MKPPPAILILTGSFGHGHNTAARNLEAAFRHALGSEAQIEVLDFFDGAFPMTNRLLRKGYGVAINSAPALWKQLYRLADNGPGRSFIPVKAMGRRLNRVLAERRPTALVSTFPGYPLLLERMDLSLGRARPWSFFTVITDAISINTIWCQGNPDLVFVTDPWSREAVGAEGIPAHRVRSHGFPLSPPTTAGAGSGETEGAAGLLGELPGALGDLPDVPPRILYLPTTRTVHVRKTLRAIEPWCRQHEARLTLVLGSHEKRLAPLAATLRERMGSALTVHGWRDDVPQLMREHHLTLTKAGGATVSETLGAHCPALINYVVPGQEEGNVTLIERSECGLSVEDTHALPAALTDILIRDHAARWHRFRANLKAMDRAHASPRIVEDVLEHLSSS